MGEDALEAPKPAPKGRSGLAIVAIVVVAIVVIGGLAYYFMTQGDGGEEEPTVLVAYFATNVLSLDPQDAYDTMSFIPIMNIYDTLIGYPEDQIDEYVGILATDWTVSDNGLYYNFTLREDVVFSNGNKFNATDVKYSLERALNIYHSDLPTTGVGWIVDQDLNMESVTIISEYEVSFKLTFAYAGFLATIAQPFPLAMVDEESTQPHNTTSDLYAFEWMKFHPMGTGPYMLDRWTVNEQTVLVRNNESWRGWSGKHYDKVILVEASSSTNRVQALIDGDADIAEIPFTNIPDVEDEAGVVVEPVKTFQLEMIAMNVDSAWTGHDFMRNPLVRQALSYAFDYDNTSEEYYAGYMDEAQGVIPNGMPLETEAQPFKGFNFSLGKASELLNTSGHPLNGQNERFNGTELSINVEAGDTERGDAAQLYRTTLSRLGIVSQVTVQPSSSAMENLRNGDEWDMYFTGWVIDYLDPDDYVLPIVVSSANWGDYFLTGVNNPAIDDAALAAQVETDQDARAADYKTVWEEFNKDPNVILVGQTNYVAFYNDNVDGFMFNPVIWYYFYWYSEH